MKTKLFVNFADNSKVDNDSKLFDEQWSKHKMNKMHTARVFGSNPQPVLERLEFKVTDNCHNCRPEEYTCSCRILQSTHVKVNFVYLFHGIIFTKFSGIFKYFLHK